jgi:hypothetical protein
VDFLESGDAPTITMKNVINREHRPPTMAGDVQPFWATYRCKGPESAPVVFTFGDQDMPGATLIHAEPSRRAGQMRMYLGR